MVNHLMHSFVAFGYGWVGLKERCEITSKNKHELAYLICQNVLQKIITVIGKSNGVIALDSMLDAAVKEYVPLEQN